jgi:hypothetical protein
MRPYAKRSLDPHFVISNEADFQRWLELVLQAEHERLREETALHAVSCGASVTETSMDHRPKIKPARQQRFQN